MSNDPGILIHLGVKLPDLIAGAAGGVVNAFIFRRVSPSAAAASVVVGALTANYLAEIAVHVFGAYSPSQGAAAFIVGLTGMVVCQTIVAAAASWRPGQPLLRNGVSTDKKG
jgi:hypothetical protein